MVQDIDDRNLKKVYKKQRGFETASSLLNEGGSWGRLRDRESFVPKIHKMMRNRKITRNLPRKLAESALQWDSGNLRFFAEAVQMPR